MKKIAIVVPHMAPYRDAVLKRASSRVDLTVYVLSKTALTHKEWGYKAEGLRCIFSQKVIQFPKGVFFHPDIFRHIVAGGYDQIIVSGHYPLTCLRIILFAIRKQIDFTYMADSINISSINMPKTILLKYILSKAKNIWVPGEFAKKQFIDIIPNKEIFEGCYIFDEKVVIDKTNEIRLNRESIRSSLDIDKESCVFLFVGKLIPSRKIGDLLSAFHCVRGNARLLIIGDGPQSNLVYDDTDSRIIYIPAVKFSELYRYYAISDCYVHPGEEPYSLAVVQAVLSDLFVVSTKSVGAVYDYITDGVNGSSVDLGDIEELKKALINYTNQYSENKALISNCKVNRSLKWATEQFMLAIENPQH